jgi:hypothetical protein
MVHLQIGIVTDTVNIRRFLRRLHPSIMGENAVCRILDKSAKSINKDNT